MPTSTTASIPSKPTPMPPTTPSAPILPKPTKVHPAIHNHIPILKRIPPQLIQRRSEGLLPPAVPVAARFALELFEAFGYEV